MLKKVLVIGGGASGLMAAIMAAKNGAEVSVFEKKDILGKKLLATGNGKCNLTNLDFDVNKYNSSNKEILNYYFGLFDEKTAIQTFNEFGLLLKDRNGYIYPSCEQASVVLDILKNKLEELNVKVFTEEGVLKILKTSQGLQVTTSKSVYVFDSVILATGSKASLGKKDSSFLGKDGYYIAQCLGHSVVPVLPALVQIECEESLFGSIAGVRADCVITLYDENRALKREFGELQITDYGISGIPVFQLSSDVAKYLAQGRKLKCVIDFMPEMEDDTFEEFMTNRIGQYTGKTVEQFFTGLLNKKLCSLFIEQSELEPNEVISPEIFKKLFESCFLIKQFVVSVKNTKSFMDAQVCSGGIPLSEVDEKLQSRIVPGLFISGELLDVDGRCGGYNLQWAWTSGAIAGIYASL